MRNSLNLYFTTAKWIRDVLNAVFELVFAKVT